MSSDEFNISGKSRTINKKSRLVSTFIVPILLLLLLSISIITSVFNSNFRPNLVYANSKQVNSHNVQLQGEIHLKNLLNITNSREREEVQVHRSGTPFSFQTLENIKLRTELLKIFGNTPTPTITQELKIFSSSAQSVPFELPFGAQSIASVQDGSGSSDNGGVLKTTPNINNPATSTTSATVVSPRATALTSILKSTTPSILKSTTPSTTATTASTATSVGFNGLSEGQIGGSYYPPDVQVAVGPSYIVEMTNLEGKVFAKTGGSVYTFSLYPFFIINSSDEISDPRIMYDAGSGRWFTAITDLTLNMVKVAVSTSSTPNAFKIFGFKFSNCPDYPTIGLNDDKFAISANLFGSNCNGSYNGVQYYIINKSYMIGSTTTPVYSRSSPNTSIFSLQPVQSLSSTSTLFMVTVSDDLSNHATVYSFSNPPSFSNVPTSIVNYPIFTTHIPPDALQRGSSNLVDTGDARVLNSPWYKGRLWLTFNDACTPSGDVETRSCARLIEINTPTDTLSQDFDVGAKGVYYFYPALRIDSGSNLLVVFGASSQSLYPSIFATGQDATGGPLDITPLTLKIGTYPETTNRFGDYFGAAVDPSNPSIIWGAGEYHISSPWSTFIATMFRK